MKRNLFIFTTSLLLAGMSVSCEKPSSSDEDGDIQGPFTLSVDKTVIEADGKDAAIFTLTDANGNDLTGSDQIKYISFENVETGDILNRTNVFTSINNGEYTFKAIYKTAESGNTVTVTAKNRLSYEKYYRMIPVYDMTDVMCPNCPSMVKALEGTAEMWKEHMIVLGIHGGFSDVDPWEIVGMGTSLMYAFGGQGWPSAVFNLDYLMKNNERNSKAVGRIIEEQLRKNPATCGLSFESELTANGSVSIKAKVNSSTGGKYNLGYMLVMDGLYYQGGHSANNDGIHNDVVVASTSNYMTYSKKDEISLGKDAESEVKEWLFDASKNHICVKIDDSNKDKCSVVVFALRETADGKTIVDNIAEAPLGQKLDYVLNK